MSGRFLIPASPRCLSRLDTIVFFACHKDVIRRGCESYRLRYGSLGFLCQPHEHQGPCLEVAKDRHGYIIKEPPSNIVKSQVEVGDRGGTHPC